MEENKIDFKQIVKEIISKTKIFLKNDLRIKDLTEKNEETKSFLRKHTEDLIKNANDYTEYYTVKDEKTIKFVFDYGDEQQGSLTISKGKEDFILDKKYEDPLKEALGEDILLVFDEVINLKKEKLEELRKKLGDEFENYFSVQYQLNKEKYDVFSKMGKNKKGNIKKAAIIVKKGIIKEEKTTTIKTQIIKSKKK